MDGFGVFGGSSDGNIRPICKKSHYRKKTTLCVKKSHPMRDDFIGVVQFMGGQNGAMSPNQMSKYINVEIVCVPNCCVNLFNPDTNLYQVSELRNNMSILYKINMWRSCKEDRRRRLILLKKTNMLG